MKDRSYPKFLSASPTFLGLGIVDLVMIALGLNLSLILGLTSLQGVFLCLGITLGAKFTFRYLDPWGLVLNLRRPKELNWQDEIRRVL